LREAQDLVLSENVTVTIKDLTAKEAMRAEQIAGPRGNSIAVRAAGAVTYINGKDTIAAYKLPILAGPVELIPAGIEAVFDELDQREYFALSEKYAEAYALTPDQLEILKKAQAAQSLLT
jgi:hypothetical protein